METDFLMFLSVKLGLADGTIRSHKYRYRKLQRYLSEKNLPLTKEGCETYIQYIRAQGYSPATLNVTIDLFRCLDLYFEDRGSPIRISSGFKRFSVEQKPIDILTPDEIEKLCTTRIKFVRRDGRWEYMDKVYLAFTAFLAYTGCRFSEAQNVCVEHLDSKTGRVLIPKSKNGTFRFVFLPQKIVKQISFLLDNKEASELVFTTTNGQPIGDSNYLPNLRKRAVQLGITKRIYPHLFRHSMATQLITDGVPISSVSLLLGHASTETTFKTYVHLADTTLRNDVYKHTLFKKAAPPSEIVQGLVSAFKSFQLDKDKRFHYVLSEKKGSLSLHLAYK